jgi:hypothetical protein
MIAVISLIDGPLPMDRQNLIDQRAGVVNLCHVFLADHDDPGVRVPLSDRRQHPGGENGVPNRVRPDKQNSGGFRRMEVSGSKTPVSEHIPLRERAHFLGGRSID